MTTKKNKSKTHTKKPVAKKASSQKKTAAKASAKNTHQAVKKASHTVTKKKPVAKSSAKSSKSRTKSRPISPTSGLLDTARATLSNAGELISHSLETARKKLRAAENDLESSFKNAPLDVSRAAASVRQMATDLISGKTAKSRS